MLLQLLDLYKTDKYKKLHPLLPVKYCDLVNYREARRVMRQHLRRCFIGDEVVHHKDRNIGNNDISNLQVMSNSEHRQLHGRYSQSQSGVLIN